MADDSDRQVPVPPSPASGGRSGLLAAGSILGKIPTWMNVVAGMIIAGGVIYAFLLPMVWGPDVQVSATCGNHRIRIDIENHGGRSATVGPPQFTIVSALRRDVVDLSPSLVDEQNHAGRIEVAAHGRGQLTYQNSLDFFGPTESAGGACHFELSVPVAGEDPQPGNCTCVYSSN